VGYEESEKRKSKTAPLESPQTTELGMVLSMPLHQCATGKRETTQRQSVGLEC
jgi:hypothetical protein